MSNGTSGCVLRNHEPIAIIGIGCRFAGVDDVESFWSVLRDGLETLTDYPGGRFERIDEAYSSDAVASRRGGFLKNLDGLDTAFFKVSGREATLMDPQQRLLLEVGWEAVEDAGIPAGQIAGSRTGVYIGLWTSDYEQCVNELTRERNLYTATGTGRYTASGRLAYFLDLRGPVITIDAACSSALAAIHLACLSLRQGVTEMALAGGVNVILSPDITLAYSASGMLSPDGRCKFGDASANGYVRSEGAGLVLLKPLSRARADGDPIYALIRGGAINNDGRSSGLLVAPGRSAQEAMLRDALLDAGVRPEQIDFIEAHGTGTAVGDPVEIESIGRVLASGERQQPCLVGSVKTNIGHTEAAAGVAGLIKAALSLERRTVPASLNFKTPNPNIPWSQIPVVMQTETTTWPGDAARPIAGVTGFGITGTNAHLILQGIDVSKPEEEAPPRAQVYALSAHTPEALAALACSWKDRLTADLAWPESLQSLAYTAARRRTHHEFRLAVVASNRQELGGQLSSWLDQGQADRVQSGRVPTERRRAVFVFPGQGGQWVGMCLSLYRDEPVFRTRLEECDVSIRKLAGWSVIERLAEENADIDIVQPCLFSVMVALAGLWRSWGLEPEAVVGHSMGETAAAVIAGALPLEDAAAVICYRSRLMKRAAGRGSMAVVELATGAGEALANEYGGRISVAASNSPTSTVLSGETEAIEDAIAKLEAREVFCRRIKVDVASHSAQMHQFREELTQLLQHVQPRAGTIPIYSTTTGQIEDGCALNAEYWGRNLCQPVLFSSALQSLLRDGFDTFHEISVHPVLLQAVEAGIRHSGKEAVAVALLRREHDERTELMQALGTLYVHGCPIDFARLYPKGECLRMPVYPWQRERHWLETSGAGRRLNRHGNHSGLGAHIESSLEPGAHFWDVDLRACASVEQRIPRLLELVMAAAREAQGEKSFVLEEAEFFGSLVTDGMGQLTVVPTGGNSYRAQVSARGQEGWIPLCRATVGRACASPIPSPPAGCRERRLEQDEADPIAACLKLAADVAGAAVPGAFLRISGIRHAAVTNFQPGTKLVARAVVSDSSSSLETECGLELEDGTRVAGMSGVRFEPTGAPDSREHIYEFDWVAGRALPDGPPSRSTWALVGERSGLAGRIAAALEAAGEACVCLPDFSGLELALHAGASYGAVIVIPRAEEMPQAMREWYRIARLVQVLARSGVGKLPRLSLLTIGAWRLGSDCNRISVGQGPVWGLGRVIAREHPELCCTNIDLDLAAGDEDFELLVRILRNPGTEEQIAVRRGKYFVMRLRRADSALTNKLPAFVADATYLITGGLGGIGLKVARWFVDRGARQIALLGRTEPSETANGRIAEMEKVGATVRVFQADVAEEAQVTSVLNEIGMTMPPLRGVLHAAVVADGALLVDVQEDQWLRVIESKALGAWNLHLCTRGLSLDFFLLFSSVATVISQPGQGSYAAANAFLDSLARYRGTIGLPAASIQWGPWSGTGLAKKEGMVRILDDYAQRGVGVMPPALALDALDRVLANEPANVLVAAVNWDAFSRTSPPPMFSGLLGAGDSRNGSELQDLRRDLNGAEPGRPRRTLLQNYLRQQLAQVLRLPVTRIDCGKTMGSMGVDSLMALEYVRRVSMHSGARIPATAVFNFCTITAFADELASRMGISMDGPGGEAKPNDSEVDDAAVTINLATLSEEDAINALMIGGASAS